MFKLTFFKGLIIGLSLSSFMWAGIFFSVKKILPIVKHRSMGETQAVPTIAPNWASTIDRTQPMFAIAQK